MQRRERVVQQFHEQPRHDVNDPNTAAPADVVLADAAPRRPRGVVHRPQHPTVGFHVGNDLGPVPGVVAAGDHVRPRFEQLLADLRGKPEAVGRILAVDDDEIERERLAELRQLVLDDVAAASSDNVSAE